MEISVEIQSVFLLGISFLITLLNLNSNNMVDEMRLITLLTSIGLDFYPKKISCNIKFSI